MGSFRELRDPALHGADGDAELGRGRGVGESEQQEREQVSLLDGFLGIIDEQRPRRGPVSTRNQAIAVGPGFNKSCSGISRCSIRVYSRGGGL